MTSSPQVRSSATSSATPKQRCAVSMPTLQGAHVTLRPAATADIPELARIRSTPEVLRWWRGGEEMVASVAEDLAEEGTETLVIEHDGGGIGGIKGLPGESPHT